MCSAADGEVIDWVALLPLNISYFRFRDFTPNTVFSDFDHGVLRDLCGFPPHLIDLRIMTLIPNWDEDDEEFYYVTEGPCWEVYDFFDTLVTDSPLPVSIQKLAIHWDFQDDKTHIEFGPPDLHKLKESLVSKHSSMKALWIDGTGLLYYWRDGDFGVQYDDNDADEEGYWGFSHTIPTLNTTTIMSSATSSTTSTVAPHHVPNEIWAEIFAHLPRELLMHVDLTHWLFHRLIRITHPLLLRDLEFHPYMDIAGYYTSPTALLRD
ncbi:hypothetical protein B0H10DRAFT_2207627 [Mycena sp. CBHHK59/15]|nr:hypothetical protein B0H10DRAFT_2207627 [Mycena sp. CBHHK59/15]